MKSKERKSKENPKSKRNAASHTGDQENLQLPASTSVEVFGGVTLVGFGKFETCKTVRDKGLKSGIDDPDIELLSRFHGHINNGEILNILSNTDINYNHLNAFKELTNFNDEVVSDWLNIDVKTLRSYKKPTNKLKENIQEKIVVLLSLLKHGIKVFGSRAEFDRWLDSENFYFDNKKPRSFLSTVTGVRFVDDNLTAIEYGDNA